MATVIFPRRAFVPVFADGDYAMPEYPWGLDEIYRSMVPVRRHRPVFSLSSCPLTRDSDLDVTRRERILDRLASDLHSAASSCYDSHPCTPADFVDFLIHLSESEDVTKSNQHPSSEEKSSTSENRCPKPTTQTLASDKTQGSDVKATNTSNSPSVKCRGQHDSASSGGCLTSSSSAVKPDETSDDRFDLSLQIGDFPPENLQVSVTDRKLNIRAHCDERDEKSGWVGHKQFEYSFHLPDNASLDSLTSSYDAKGVLSITASKTDNPTRQVPVQIRDALESVKSAQSEEHEVQQTTSSVNDSIDTLATESAGEGSRERAEDKAGNTVGDGVRMEEEKAEEQEAED